MAKKHWNKNVRAEVAAALQSTQPGSTPNPGSTPRLSTSSTAQTGGATIAADIGYVRNELLRIFWVALGLFALLAIATVTDKQSHWLGELARSIETKL